MTPNNHIGTVNPKDNEGHQNIYEEHIKDNKICVKNIWRTRTWHSIIRIIYNPWTTSRLLIKLWWHVKELVLVFFEKERFVGVPCIFAMARAINWLCFPSCASNQQASNLKRSYILFVLLHKWGVYAKCDCSKHCMWRTTLGKVYGI